MMQDTLLRVFVVALGLLTYPRNDPCVEEWDQEHTVAMQQKHKERLLKGHDLDHIVAPVGEEFTHLGNKSPQGDIKNIHGEQNQADQHVAEKDPMSGLADGIVDKQEEHSTDLTLPEGTGFPLSMSQNAKSNPDTNLEASEQIINLVEEKEVVSSIEHGSPLSHHHTETSDIDTSENAIADWERDYLWYMWNTISIISMIRFFRKYLGRDAHATQEHTRTFPAPSRAAGVPLPDSQTLQRFHSKSIQVSSNKKWREEFLEGFANDLSYAMRTVCDKNGGMSIEDFEMVDVCDIIVPITPPEPYSFQCLLLENQPCDLPPNMQVCGQVNLVENKKILNGCPCQSPDADDMVCLLHCETEKEKIKMADAWNGLLCMENAPFLSKSRVTRWFQNTIKQAWAQISHKYEFELNIRYIDAPGALVIRFRSGKNIRFSMNPVVRFNTDAHFFITSGSPKNLDSFWTLSLTNYENRFLERISKRLPDDSCHRQTLEIAHFLHKGQTALSGSSALETFHFKTALIHLLLNKDPSQWKPTDVAFRLRDLLEFMERSLEKKLLPHALIGNPLTHDIQLPAEFTGAKAVNLFHHLVAHDCIYKDAVLHFKEMLRNTHMLIHDYVDKCIDHPSSVKIVFE